MSRELFSNLASYEFGDFTRAGLRRVRHNVLNSIASLACLELSDVHGPDWTAVLRKVTLAIIKKVVTSASTHAVSKLTDAPMAMRTQAAAVMLQAAARRRKAVQVAQTSRVVQRLSDARSTLSDGLSSASHQATAAVRHGARTARESAASLQRNAAAVVLQNSLRTRLVANFRPCVWSGLRNIFLRCLETNSTVHTLVQKHSLQNTFFPPVGC